jgi:hypothetical protein
MLYLKGASSEGSEKGLRVSVLGLEKGLGFEIGFRV